MIQIIQMILVLFIFFEFCFAKDIYVSSSSKVEKASCKGNATYPFNDLNTALALLQANDRLLLKRGDIFSGTFVSDADNITIESYGDARLPNPILTQSVPIDPVKCNEQRGTLGSIRGVYKYDLSTIMTNASEKYIWSVWVDGYRYTPARYPNLKRPGYYYGASEDEFIYTNGLSSNGTLFTSYNLTEKNQWIGYTIRIRSKNTEYTRAKIMDVGLTNITINQPLNFPDQVKLGFYIEGSPLELDNAGEFYYDSATKFLYLVPCNKETCFRREGSYMEGGWLLTGSKSQYDSGVDLSGTSLNLDSCKSVRAINLVKGYCPFDSYPYALKLNGKNNRLSGIDFSQSFTGMGVAGSNTTISHIKASKLLDSGVKLPKESSGTIQNSVFFDADINGIYSTASYLLIKNNHFSEIALFAGYSKKGSAIECTNCLIASNNITNMGFSGIYAHSNVIVESNRIANWTISLSKGGAIHVSPERACNVSIKNNYIDGINYANAISSGYLSGYEGAAIYLDNGSEKLNVTGNIISSTTVTRFCIKIVNVNQLNLENNVCVGGIDIKSNSSSLNTVVYQRNNFTVDYFGFKTFIKFLIDSAYNEESIVRGIKDNNFILNNCLKNGVNDSLLFENLRSESLLSIKRQNQPPKGYICIPSHFVDDKYHDGSLFFDTHSRNYSYSPKNNISDYTYKEVECPNAQPDYIVSSSSSAIATKTQSIAVTSTDKPNLLRPNTAQSKYVSCLLIVIAFLFTII